MLVLAFVVNIFDISLTLRIAVPEEMQLVRQLDILKNAQTL